MNKILIANRGEIAVRILRTCREMGIRAAAVYSECDRSALHVQLADEAYFIGPDRAADSYLRIDALIDAARAAKAEAIHPGYGFLSESPLFAEACHAAGITFIGPAPAAMRRMGSKTAAREIARRAGVPVLPGTDPLDPATGAGSVEAAAREVGYPLLVKAVAGGGGKGMRIVREPAELATALSIAQSEAASAFGDGAVYLEKLLQAPRHVEVQLIGDHHGAIVPFVERECSIQRRHQKLIEETPSPAVGDTLRARLTRSAAAIAAAAGYTNAGTVEFLVTGDAFYFLEMNARLQVEHPVTEAVTGLDLVRAQIEVARGRPLDEVLAGATVDAAGFVRGAGHSIEVRVYAEDPDRGFLPSPGTITYLRAPSGPGVREDSGAFEGWEVPTAYDPLVSKLIVWAPDRARAIARMLRALREYDVRGIPTTIAFCCRLMRSAEFESAAFDTETLDRWVTPAPSEASIDLAAVASALWMVMQPPGPRNVASPLPSPWMLQGRADAVR